MALSFNQSYITLGANRAAPPIPVPNAGPFRRRGTTAPAASHPLRHLSRASNRPPERGRRPGRAAPADRAIGRTRLGPPNHLAVAYGEVRSLPQPWIPGDNSPIVQQPDPSRDELGSAGMKDGQAMTDSRGARRVAPLRPGQFGQIGAVLPSMGNRAASPSEPCRVMIRCSEIPG
jgi:hypothetical protein